MGPHDATLGQSFDSVRRLRKMKSAPVSLLSCFASELSSSTVSMTLQGWVVLRNGDCGETADSPAPSVVDVRAPCRLRSSPREALRVAVFYRAHHIRAERLQQ